MPEHKLKFFHLQPTDAPLMEKLSADHKTILEAEGSYEEIATKLSLNIGTVKSRKHRARERLIALRTEAAQRGNV